MGKVFWLAYHTTLEILRERILYTAVFFGILLIAIGGVLDTAAPGQRGVVVADIGLGAINLFGVIIAIVMGVNLLYQELDRKTVYNLLAKPISRAQFVLGKYLGLVGAIAAVVLAMVICFLVAMVMVGGGTLPPPLAWQALWTIFCELAMVAGLAMVFSSFSTPYLSGLFTFAIWVVGSMAHEIRNFQMIAKLRGYRSLVEGAFYVLPDFSKLNLKDRVPYLLDPPQDYLWQITLYAALYCAALLGLAVVIFRRRDFK